MRKVFIALMIAFVSQFAVAQKIKMDRSLMGGDVRAIATDDVKFASGVYSQKDEPNDIRFEVGLYLLKGNTPEAKRELGIKSGNVAITINLNLDCRYEMYISKGKTVIFKLSNGTNVQFKPLMILIRVMKQPSMQGFVIAIRIRFQLKLQSNNYRV